MKRWKYIKGYRARYGGRYKISDHGDVKVYTTKGWRLRKASTNAWGYKFIRFTDANGDRVAFMVHRLVGLYFIPNPHNLPEINHKDYDRGNNHYLNLEWCTTSHNALHRWARS